MANKIAGFLAQADQKEISQLHKALADLEKAPVPASLRKRMAALFQRLVRDYENVVVNDIAQVIAGFIQYEFGDALDDIISMAGELELPARHQSGDELDSYARMTKMIEDYVA